MDKSCAKLLPSAKDFSGERKIESEVGHEQVGHLKGKKQNNEKKHKEKIFVRTINRCIDISRFSK